MDNLNRPWRKFLQHLGSYVIVIGALAVINGLTSDNAWFIWPAMAWGVGLAFHFTQVLFHDTLGARQLNRRWRRFFDHLRSYVIIIGMLAAINLLTSGGYLWFVWPAFGWGIGLAFHFMGALFGEGGEDDEESDMAASTWEAEAEETAPVSRPTVEERSGPIQRPADTGELASATLQTHLERARAYQVQIEQVIRAAGSDTGQTRRQELAAQVAEWVKAIESLARRVDDFQQNRLIHQDLKNVPQAIEELEARLTGETDSAIRTQLEHTLTNRQNQLAALEKLQRTMHQAEIQIESTLSSLGTIYSQLLTGQSTDHVADYSRLSAEADEEVRTLQDKLEALEEVKMGRS